MMSWLWVSLLAAVMAAGCAVGCAVAYTRLARRTRRWNREHAEDQAIANWARTHVLVVDLPSGKMNVRLDRLRWGTDHTRQLRGGFVPPAGVRIEYRGGEVTQTPDKGENVRLR